MVLAHVYFINWWDGLSLNFDVPKQAKSNKFWHRVGQARPDKQTVWCGLGCDFWACAGVCIL